MQKSEMTMKPQIELSKTTSIPTENGGVIWQQGVVLRKVSRFITGGDDDAVLPIPVFYDPETGKILKQGLPPELQGEYDTV